MLFYKFTNNTRFYLQLGALENAQRQKVYLPWYPMKDCITYVVLDRGVKVDILRTLAGEKGYSLSCYNVTKPSKVKRYLNGKPKDGDKGKVISLKAENLIDLFLYESHTEITKRFQENPLEEYVLKYI